ncbi:MAG: winged helix-turn-helix domain-containing protein [Candidatus Omnitrophota bacterium]
MITEIGIAAGDVWHYLDGHGESALSQMVKNIDKPRELLLMSVGWLAREGHVVLIKTEGNDYRISLRK